MNVQSLASLSRGDLAYVVADLDGPVPEATLKAIERLDGVLMMREL